MDFKKHIRSIPDYPKPGINFIDITTLLKDGEAFNEAIIQLAAQAGDKNIDLVAGPEARGFVIGAALAHQLHAGFVPIRKPGKLPAATSCMEYSLEYGTDMIEMHNDAVMPGQRVLIVDDLLATGGTAQAAGKLIEQAGGIVAGMAFLVELTFLSGRQKLGRYPIVSLVQY